jgi:hypothetical protein
MIKFRQGSWSGSEQLRRPQGVCLPPTKLARHLPRFRVPAGIPVWITRESPVNWKEYLTTRATVFQHFVLMAVRGWHVQRTD